LNVVAGEMSPGDVLVKREPLKFAEELEAI